ncbi:M48 family metalloprotease [Aquisphaera giovannonii]|uniref:M48 family metalloprotease n=1 Tax=Aquisphaera giovannonii TaxID=406548 RepID=UPI001AEFF7F3|nr:M48 family metalloprotease [Aquisphaera giovannonii]
MAAARPAPPPAPATADPTPAAAPAAVKSAARGPVTQQDLVVVNAWFGRPMAARKWDLSRVTAEQEAELGRELHDLVLAFYKPVADGSLKRRVLEAADPIWEARSRKDLGEPNITILDSDAVVAFSHPGGYIYLTRGLLDWIGEEDDEVLQFALAHEVHHIDGNDALRCLSDPKVQALPFGTATLFYLLIFPRAYTDKMEYDADAWAYLQMRRLRYSDRMSLMFLEKLNHSADRDADLLEGRALPGAKGLASLFENHYRAHPSIRTRLKKIRELSSAGTSKKN